MMLMPSSHSSAIIHYWAGKYPNRIGWLFGPSAMKKTKLRKWIPFALDNDAFSAWTNGTEWDEGAWFKMLENIKRSAFTPLWALVPDVVADKDKTLEKWRRYAGFVDEMGWSKAFAVQDGMVPSDVPDNADIVFVGGTTEWKWRSLSMWSSEFLRIHVGRVNSLDRLWTCEDLGVESVDGTGWFRDSAEGYRMQQIELWLNNERRNMEMFTMCELTGAEARKEETK